MNLKHGDVYQHVRIEYRSGNARFLEHLAARNVYLNELVLFQIDHPAAGCFDRARHPDHLGTGARRVVRRAEFRGRDAASLGHDDFSGACLQGKFNQRDYYPRIGRGRRRPRTEDIRLEYDACACTNDVLTLGRQGYCIANRT